jgi:hypothetical protein
MSPVMLQTYGFLALTSVTLLIVAVAIVHYYFPVDVSNDWLMKCGSVLVSSVLESLLPAAIS